MPRARRTKPAAAAKPNPDKLTPAERALLERLVDRGALVAVPALKSQKPRKVTAAALTRHGAQVLLYLSAKPFEFER